MSVSVHEANTSEKPKPPDYNVFRDSCVRYLGYANELGESFRYQFPRLVVPSYIVSFTYCGMDAAWAGYRTWKEHPRSHVNELSAQRGAMRPQERDVAIATFDTLVWQSLASVMIPGATINAIVKASRFAVARTSLPLIVMKWFPTVAGIASIPYIVEPIDKLVDFSLDSTMRQWIKK